MFSVKNRSKIQTVGVKYQRRVRITWKEKKLRNRRDLDTHSTFTGICELSLWTLDNIWKRPGGEEHGKTKQEETCLKLNNCTVTGFWTPC